MKFISLKFIFISLCVSLALNLEAKDKAYDCVDCMGPKAKIIDGQPDKKPFRELVASTQKPIAIASTIVTDVSVIKSISPRESYQDAFCMQYEAAEDTVDVETIFEKMEASPYTSSLNEFWSTPACHSPRKNDTTVPILFNTATTAVRSEKFPQVVHDYFVLDKKDPESWLKAINTKTSDGLTFLDFMQYSLNKGNYDSKIAGEAAQRIVAYLCKNGGVYSKYVATSKCL